MTGELYQELAVYLLVRDDVSEWLKVLCKGGMVLCEGGLPLCEGGILLTKIWDKYVDSEMGRRKRE